MQRRAGAATTARWCDKPIAEGFSPWKFLVFVLVSVAGLILVIGLVDDPSETSRPHIHCSTYHDPTIDRAHLSTGTHDCPRHCLSEASRCCGRCSCCPLSYISSAGQPPARLPHW